LSVIVHYDRPLLSLNVVRNFYVQDKPGFFSDRSGVGPFGKKPGFLAHRNFFVLHTVRHTCEDFTNLRNSFPKLLLCIIRSLWMQEKFQSEMDLHINQTVTVKENYD